MKKPQVGLMWWKRTLFLGVYKLWNVCEDCLYRYAVVSIITRDAAVAAVDKAEQ